MSVRTVGPTVYLRAWIRSPALTEFFKIRFTGCSGPGALSPHEWGLIASFLLWGYMLRDEDCTRENSDDRCGRSVNGALPRRSSAMNHFYSAFPLLWRPAAAPCESRPRPSVPLLRQPPRVGGVKNDSCAFCPPTFDVIWFGFNPRSS